LLPELQPCHRALVAGASPHQRPDHALLRAWHFAGDAAADLVRPARGPLAAAPRPAPQRRVAGAGHGPADHHRALADAPPGAARGADGAGVRAGAAVSFFNPYDVVRMIQIKARPGPRADHGGQSKSPEIPTETHAM